MLILDIEDVELFDETTGSFITIKGGTFRLEHSLEAIAKWESKWKIPYLKAEYTPEQERDYYLTMSLDEGFTELHLTNRVLNEIVTYINDPHTATTITPSESKESGKVITTEELYATMAIGQIPFECDKWNFNRLLMLIQIIGDKHAPKKKMTNQEIIEQNRKLNEERKKKYNTKG